MITVVIQQWADEGRVVCESIDYDVFQVRYVDGMGFVPTVNEMVEAGDFGDARVCLLDGSVTLEPGCLQALEDAMVVGGIVGLASAYTDGQPFAGEVSPHCCLFREGVLAQLRGLNPKLHCYAWERDLAARLAPWEWRTAHVVGARTTTLHHAGRLEALGPHYYDQLADDELARS
jgi:hypothetical protein